MTARTSREDIASKHRDAVSRLVLDCGRRDCDYAGRVKHAHWATERDDHCPRCGNRCTDHLVEACPCRENVS